MYFYIDYQILIYVKVERKVENSKVIKAIKIRFTLLSKKKELVISTLTDSIIYRIGISIIHIILRVSNKIKKNYQVKTNTQ